MEGKLLYEEPVGLVGTVERFLLLPKVCVVEREDTGPTCVRLYVRRPSGRFGVGKRFLMGYGTRDVSEDLVRQSHIREETVPSASGVPRPVTRPETRAEKGPTPEHVLDSRVGTDRLRVPLCPRDPHKHRRSLFSPSGKGGSSRRLRVLGSELS